MDGVFGVVRHDDVEAYAFLLIQEQEHATSITRSSRPFSSTHKASGTRHRDTQWSACEVSDLREYNRSSGRAPGRISSDSGRKGLGADLTTVAARSYHET